MGRSCELAGGLQAVITGAGASGRRSARPRADLRSGKLWAGAK